VFHAARPYRRRAAGPTHSYHQALSMKLLTRKGALIEEQGMTYLAATFRDTALGPLQGAACTYRIALAPRPRLPLRRFDSVLAPNAKLRPEIVPGRPVNSNDILRYGKPPLPCASRQRFNVLWPIMQCGRVKVCAIWPHQGVYFRINPYLVKQ
jgi:hypothetical protein